MQTNQQNSDKRKTEDERMALSIADCRLAIGKSKTENRKSRISRPSSVIHRPSSFFCRASFQQRIIAAAICLAVAAFFGAFALAGRYNIDVGRLTGYCGFKLRTGFPCPTCGMTTATLAFAQGRVLEAFYIQPACGLLCCIAVAAALVALIVAVSGVYFSFIRRFFAEVKLRYIILALIVIVAAGWAVTLARALAATGQ